MSIYVVFIAFNCIHQDDDYVFEHSKLTVTGFVGKNYCRGYIDEHGTFIPDITTLDTTGIGRDIIGPLAPHYSMGFSQNQSLYEFRSGILIPMIYDSKRGIIPEVGGKIIDFKDYKYSPTARPIYNLPGRFVLKKREDAREEAVKCLSGSQCTCLLLQRTQQLRKRISELLHRFLQKLVGYLG